MKTFAVAGMAFGDEGKGHIVDYLCEEHNINLVVRCSGGPQNSHTVVRNDGREHRFAQFGSGMFRPNCRTQISKHVLVEPFSMFNEVEALSVSGVKDVMQRTTIDPECLVITPWHWMTNQIREIERGDRARHGSCGRGIGETKRMELNGLPVLRVRDLTMGHIKLKTILFEIKKSLLSSLPPITLQKSDALLEKMYGENLDYLILIYRRWVNSFPKESLRISENVVFENGQGVLLDEHYGLHPYRTWSKTTFQNANEICQEQNLNPVRIGVFRRYFTRHGAGPFPTENPAFCFPDHNTKGEYQGRFRQGPFDMTLALYAIDCCYNPENPSHKGIDHLAITCMDRLHECSEFGRSSEYGNPWFGVRRYTKGDIENNLGVPISIYSFGPETKDCKGIK